MERKNEKEINCNQAQELFYGFTACELSSEDMRLLSRHEASCPACGPEFQEWRRLRQALQSSGIAPTTDFKAGVMGRIRSTRKAPAAQRSRSGVAIWQHGWARGVAAAAVVLIMLTGVAKLPTVENLVAHSGKPATVALEQNPTGGQEQVQPTAPASPVQKPPKQTASNNTPSTNSAPSVQPVQPKPQETPGGNKEPQIPSGGPFIVSSEPMVITTTTIQIAVNNLDQAQSAALSIADAWGATLSSEQSAQDSGHSMLFLHFTVDPEKANAFLSRLDSLGSVVSEDTVNKDVTGDYSSALEKYQALEAQQSAAADSDNDQYTSQITMLESELQNWHDASGKQIVVLWMVE
jgi:hypothetical protein